MLTVITFGPVCGTTISTTLAAPFVGTTVGLVGLGTMSDVGLEVGLTLGPDLAMSGGRKVDVVELVVVNSDRNFDPATTRPAKSECLNSQISKTFPLTLVKQLAQPATARGVRAKQTPTFGFTLARELS